MASGRAHGVWEQLQHRLDVGVEVVPAFESRHVLECSTEPDVVRVDAVDGRERWLTD